MAESRLGTGNIQHDIWFLQRKDYIKKAWTKKDIQAANRHIKMLFYTHVKKTNIICLYGNAN